MVVFHSYVSLPEGNWTVCSRKIIMLKRYTLMTWTMFTHWCQRFRKDNSFCWRIFRPSGIHREALVQPELEIFAEGDRWDFTPWSNWMSFGLPSSHLTVCHEKSPFSIGKPSINGPFPMAMLNNQRVSLLSFLGSQTSWPEMKRESENERFSQSFIALKPSIVVSCNPKINWGSLESHRVVGHLGMLYGFGPATFSMNWRDVGAPRQQSTQPALVRNFGTKGKGFNSCCSPLPPAA